MCGAAGNVQLQLYQKKFAEIIIFEHMIYFYYVQGYDSHIGHFCCFALGYRYARVGS